MSLNPIKKSAKSEYDDLLVSSEEQSSEAKPAFESGEFLPAHEKEVAPEKEAKESFYPEKSVKTKKSPQSHIALSHIKPAKSPTLVAVEKIMEQDLADVYFQMAEKDRKIFQLQGEKTAKKIEYLLSKTKDTTKKVFKLILKWLNLIPGINKFFIRQEAMIKAENIMKLKDKNR